MTGGGAMLAALINPALFWGGAAAVSVPIVIHLLARRRFRRVRWAAMTFLLDAEKRNKRRVRVEELILLALRCLAILLLGLFIARPFIKPTGIASVLGGSERTERVFMLDDSFSMGYLTEGKTAFDRAKESVLNLVNRLREHAPGDTITILRTSQPDAPVVAGALLDDEQIESLLSRLEALEPSQRALSVTRCMDGARQALERDPSIVSAVVYLLSDFQRVDWVHSAGAKSLAEPLDAWTRGEHAARVVLVDVGDDNAQNVAITALEPVQRQLVTGVEAPLEVEFGNFSSADTGALELDVTIGQRSGASVRVPDIPAGGRTRAPVSTVFTQTGDEVVRMSLPKDDLPIDDARAIVARINDAVRVLIINGEPSTDAYLDEVSLLTTALRPEGEVFSGNRVDVIDETQLDAAHFEDYHLVVLCNLYRVSEPVADALHRFVFNGGGLLVFPGDQVSDPALFNATLFRGGEGLLPASLQAIIQAPESGVTLGAGDWRHPVVRVFSGEENPFRRRIHFFQYFALEPAEAPEADTADIDAPIRPAARVIARFDDADQSPAIVERAYGAGRVMLFASTCDLEWNDWARDASFVVTTQEMVQYLARASAGGDAVTVGEPVRVAIDPSRFEQHALLREPGYPQVPEEDITAAPEERGGLALRWEQTERAGIYTFLLRGLDGEQQIRRVAVTLDPNESDLSPAQESELREAFGNLPVDYVAGIPARDDAADEGRKELWPSILVMALIALFLEQFLAWRFGKS
ncbi:MAG: BatA domain-containing protein [Phycisphaerales bacterium]|nr:BatA domain-containing protein [Phycisphaerales bacterium]